MRTLPWLLALATLIFVTSSPALAIPPPMPPGPPKCYAAEVPGDVAFLAAIRPSQILSRTRGASMIALLHEFDDLGGSLGDMMSPARLLLDYVGSDWNDVAEIVYVLQSVKFPQPNPPADPDAAPRPPQRPAFNGELIILQMNNGPIDQVRVRSILRNVGEEVGLGKRYWGSGKDGEERAMFFPDDRTVVVGSETMVRRFIQGKKAEGVLAAPLAALNQTDHLAVLLDLKQMGPMVTQVVRQAQLLAEAKSAVLTAKFLDVVSAKLTIEAKREEDAEGYRALFETSIGQIKEDLKQQVNRAGLRMPEDEAGKKQHKLTMALFELAKQAIQNLKLESKGSTFTAQWKPEAGLKIAEDFTPLLVRNGVAFDPKQVTEKWIARQYRPNDPLVAQMQRLLPAAAGMANGDMAAIGQSPTAPKIDSLNDASFTLAMLLEKSLESQVEKRFEGRSKELKFLQSMRPHLLAATAAKSAWFGYCTLLPANSIRRVECQEKEGLVTGVAEFESPFMFKGIVEFTAKKMKSGWEIVEFRLPARGTKLERAPGDNWQFSNTLGKGGVPTKLRGVKGTITLNGKPVANARVEFLFKPTADYFLARTDARGKFEAELPPGKYVVPIPLPAKPESDEREGEERQFSIIEVEVPAEGEVNLELKG